MLVETLVARRTRPAVRAAFAAAVLLLSGTTIAACSPRGSRASSAEPGEAASCAAILVFEGRTYLGMGTLRRDPPAGRLLGTGTLPPCDDTGGAQPGKERGEHVHVHAFPAVPPDELIESGGDLWMAKDATLPRQLRYYFKPVTCTSTRSFAVVGQWLSVTPGKVQLRPPYRIGVHVDSASGQAAGYVGATIHVEVTIQTRPTLSEHDVDRALLNPGTLQGLVHCDGSAFVADSLRTRAN